MESIKVYNKKGADKISVNLSALIFKEDSNFIFYAPSLDLSGYGKTEAEAKKSFEIVLKETLAFCISKNTLKKMLINQGWVFMPGTRPIYKSPSMMSKIATNDYLQNILNENSEVKVKNNLELSFV